MRKPPISDDLQTALEHRAETLLAQAENHFQAKIGTVTLRVNLTGIAAGKAYPGENLIRLNAELLTQQPEPFLRDVVAHEIAHIVAYRVHGRGIRPHGPEWAAVMRLFAVEPRRCHDFDVSQLRQRRQRRHRYRCACRAHELSSTRHNRVRRGEQSYLCRRCGEALVESGT